MMHGFGSLGILFGAIKLIAGVAFLYFAYDIAKSLRRIATNLDKNHSV